MLATVRTEFNLQVLHILANDFVSFFSVLCHLSMSIHQKFIKHHRWLSSTFYTYMEAAVNLPVGRILAKFIEPTAPGTQLNISEGGI